MAPAAMQVVELRNYLLAEGATADFIRNFEEHFLFSQRDEGMHPLGQFEVIGEPNRFVWIRGFDDMPARFRGLSGFYGGAFWQAHRIRANSMIREHHDVHLLRPRGPILTGGMSLEDRASEPPGTLRPDTGLVVVDFYRAAGALARLVTFFEERMQPALVEQGHQVLGHFVAELTPNDYPRLPVIQDPALLVVLSAYRDHADYVRLATAWRTTATACEDLSALLTAEVTTLSLRPTVRSVIRYQPLGSAKPASRRDPHHEPPRAAVP
jgi:hypothetical protein